MMTEPRVLIPYIRAEALTLEQAAKIAGRSETTIRSWCSRFSIGRRVVGGPWQVSRVALAMLLDGNEAALSAYLSGDRASDSVVAYFEAAGVEVAKAAEVATSTNTATSTEVAKVAVFAYTNSSKMV